MDERTNLSSGAKWEDIVGYSRAVKIGNLQGDNTLQVHQANTLVKLTLIIGKLVPIYK